MFREFSIHKKTLNNPYKYQYLETLDLLNLKISNYLIMQSKTTIDVTSEIGQLEAVILHTPGHEVENMTPSNAERALYSDILNLSVASEEYRQLSGLLNKVTKTFQVKDLLVDVLQNSTIKHNLIQDICKNEFCESIADELHQLPTSELATKLIEGVELTKDTLTSYLSPERYALRPLHNFFFTRDASASLYNRALISKMANKVREREPLIMQTIFANSSFIEANPLAPVRDSNFYNDITIEGGDVIIARHDILVVGQSLRTSPQGIDFLANHLKTLPGKRYLVVQQLPDAPESFIHLDMVFTLLDHDTCMIYEPVILHPNRLQTILMTIDNGQIKKIENKENLLQCLRSLGMDLNPLFCGGRKDLWIQEREQWHSGANFFAFAPGKVIGYARNVNTMEELNNHGYEIVDADDIISNKTDVNSLKKCAVTIEGAELSRGGGGARCMTMPIKRKTTNFT